MSRVLTELRNIFNKPPAKLPVEGKNFFDFGEEKG